MSFDELNLNNPLRNALNDLGYVDATPIQQQVFPAAMSGRDIIGIAQTGTGKTFAYLLPLLRQLTYSDQKYPRILIVVPTRELVLQVLGEIKKLTTYMNVRSEGVYGGTNINTQKQLIYNGVDILVATPGRLVDLAMAGVLRLKSIQKLVIDEVDELLDQGFRSQLINLLETLPEKRQSLMFSATLTENVEQLINEYFIRPLKIEIAAHGTPLEQIVQKLYHVPNFNTKVNLLELILSGAEEFNKVLVFAATKKLADRLYEQVANKFPEQVGVIHSNKSQNYRINAVKNFQEDKHRILIATDIIARGLDLHDVSHVINFDIPEVAGDYIHRIGRTGRADKNGVAISFCNEAEENFITEIEKMMRLQIPVEPLPAELIISNVYTEEEKPSLFDKGYLKKVNLKSQGAFHEKKEKNKKVNLGGPRMREALKRKPLKQNNKNKYY